MSRNKQPSTTHCKQEIDEGNTLAKTENPDDFPELVLSNKGGPKLIYQGYMYTMHKKQPKHIRWRCVGRSTYCRGGVITTINCEKPRLRKEHNHKPDYVAVQVARKRYMELGKPRILMDDKGDIKTASDSERDPLAIDSISPQKPEIKDIRVCEKQNVRPQTDSRAGPRKKKSFKTATTSATPTGRLVLVTGSDGTKLTAHRIIQDQRLSSSRNATTSAASNEDVLETTTLEGITMKQEPEDEEDCYFGDSGVTSPPSISKHSAATHRVRSHARSLRAMANPSAVWAHFDLCANDPLRAQCRICGAVVVRGGANPRQCGTTNLHRHLRVHHGGRLIGRRYHVIQSSGSSQATTGKTIRIATQSFVRPHIRNIAPAPSPQQQQQQQQQRQPKTLVLKTIPLKVKQVAPTTIKMPPRQIQQGTPQNIVHQQPTEVCLRWNSYHSNMQNSFPFLLDSEQFVDVTLACEGRSLKCHKMILSSCSDYLAELLRDNPCQHPIILMKDLKFWEVEALVKFMYRGEVNVAHDKLPQLLNAAEALQVKGLAGPSPSVQNSKPPMLIPQTKTVISQPVVQRVVSEAKESNRPSPSNIAPSSSPKRAPKRQPPEPLEPRPFTKIRLQRPVTPTTPLTAVKTEPLDIPLSPTDMFPSNNEENSNPETFEKLISLHEEDDPGGDELQDENREINFCEIPGPTDLNDCEEQMEFVPTDFLEQEQDIVEDSEANGKRDGKEEFTDQSSVDVEERDEDNHREEGDEGDEEENEYPKEKKPE